MLGATICKRGTCLATITTVAMAFFAAGPAFAEDLRLRLKGGGFEITGTLKSYEGDKYIIESPVFGVMTIDGDRFDCLAGPCPTGGQAGAPRTTAALDVATPRPAGSDRDIIIAGSNTIGNALMPALIEKYATKQGYEATRVVGADPLDLDFQLKDSAGRQVGSIRLERHGSSTSFKELEAGRVEIGMSSRPIKDKEVETLARFGNMRLPTHEHVIGLDGLMVIVSPDNPAVSISIENVSRIFAGQITDWSQIGLPGGPINVYAPTEDSGTFETFNTLVLKPNNVELAPSTKRTENHSEQSDWVAADPQGIGFVGIAYQRNAKALNIQSACGLITRPTRFGMKTEEYPLTRRLYLYTPGTPRSSLARDLMQFSLSDEAQEAVSSVDFIDQKPEGLPFKDQGARIAYALNATEEDFDIDAMRSLITDISSAQRLTSTLRFETASFALDSKAAADVTRLAGLLRSPEYQGREVMLIGFADAVGGYEPNLALSQRRAEAVATALRQAGYQGAITKGYSELAPVACNDTPENRAFNRRVEVWVK